MLAIFTFTSPLKKEKKHALASAIKILQGTTFILSMFFFRKTHHKKLMQKYALSFLCVFSQGSPHIHTRKLTSSRKGAVFKEKFIFQPLIFRGYVSSWWSNKKHVFPGKNKGHYITNPNNALLQGKSSKMTHTFASSWIPKKKMQFNNLMIFVKLDWY